jgi:putative hydrolase of the HAD superfamily
VLRGALFDLDGVLRHHDPAHPGQLEAEAGLPAGTFHAIAFEAAQLTVAVDGRATFEQWRNAVAEGLASVHGVDHGSAVRLTDRFFSVDAIAVDAAVLELVRRVRRTVPVGLLTNATSRLDAELEALGLTGEFDVVANSWELGVAKPEPAAFRLAAERLGVEPSACFFTDDRLENVEAAAAVGLTAHHFTGIDGLRDALAPLLAESP